METAIQFLFRGKEYSANVIFSLEQSPFYLFVLFQSKELMLEFGEDITIKTDCEKVLSKKDDYPTLRELREAIFYAIKPSTAFILARQKANC